MLEIFRELIVYYIWVYPLETIWQLCNYVYHATLPPAVEQDGNAHVTVQDWQKQQMVAHQMRFLMFLILDQHVT